MDSNLVQRLITELDNLTTKVWDLATKVQDNTTRLGLLQKILLLILAGMIGLTWTIFTKK